MSAAAKTLPIANAPVAQWWTRPPGAAPNAPILYVVQVVNDGLSSSQRIILAAMRDGGQKKDDHAWICDPGGYSAIGRATGLCRKTVYNNIRDLKRKGVITEFNIVMRGRKRDKTIWRIAPYRAILDGWRADAALFHTALGRPIARGRRKLLMSAEDAVYWQVDGRRAPKRGSGRALTEYALERIARKKAPAPAPMPSDEDLTLIYQKLQWAQARPNLKDAIDVIRTARREAERLAAGELPAEVIAQLIEFIARDYKPSREYPEPRVGWFLTKLPGHVGEWAARNRPPDPRSRTG